MRRQRICVFASVRVWRPWPFAVLWRCDDLRFPAAFFWTTQTVSARFACCSETIIEEGLLDDREQLVHKWMCEGKTNEVIGLIVGMKTATVKKHVSRILEKLGLENRTAAALRGNGLTA